MSSINLLEVSAMKQTRNCSLVLLGDSYTTFAGHMETVRSSRNVAMYTITLTQNDRGEATVSVEAYGEALYRAFL